MNPVILDSHLLEITPKIRYFQTTFKLDTKRYQEPFKIDEFIIYI